MVPANWSMGMGGGPEVVLTKRMGHEVAAKTTGYLRN